jgi:hypothetical protein
MFIECMTDPQHQRFTIDPIEVAYLSLVVSRQICWSHADGHCELKASCACPRACHVNRLK